MTSYNVIKPIESKVLGIHDSGIINVNLSVTGNELVDGIMNEAQDKEVSALIENGSLEEVK